MNKGKRRGAKAGMALAVVLIFVLVLAVASAAFLGVTNSDLHQTHREVEAARAFYVAQAGIEKAVAELTVLYSRGTGHTAAELKEIGPPTYRGFTFETFAVAPLGPSAVGKLECGRYAGLSGTTRRLKITAAVSSQRVENLTVRLSEEVEAQFIPIFQFAIFYDKDLEILPGPKMSVGGPVHCNSDIYVGSNESLSFDSKVTSAGDIFHRRKDGSESGGGSVRVKDGEGVYRDMRNADGTWLDSEHKAWAAGSQERWDGSVASATHRVSRLQLPLVSPEWPRAIVERGDALDTPELKEAKYYYKADLRIIDGQAYDAGGAPVDLTYPDPLDPGKKINPVSTRTFYNYREGTTVSVTEVDVAKLRASGKAPANGILYVSDDRSGFTKQDAVRLVNGEALPTGGFTVATDNPLYIQGDYNTKEKQPASVMCDAINILSNSWQDERSKEDLSRRVASATTINVAVIAGNTVTEKGQYNGGVENMPRFLEQWDGKTLRYRGSLVALWESQIATGEWVYGSPCYTAPNRDWYYDTDLSDPAKAPPGMPSVFSVAKVRWQYE